MILENTPLLRTDRLILRKFELSDADAAFRIFSDKEVNTFLPWHCTTTIEEAIKIMEKMYIDTYANTSGYRYAICLKENNVPIGYVGLADDDSHDFGYAVAREYWGLGIVAEACRAIVDRIAAAGYTFITATHDINNPASGAVMQKIGMTYKYSYDECVQPKNNMVTFRMYQLNFDGSTSTYEKYRNKYPYRIENITPKY